jgi:hypothetical protein
MTKFEQVGINYQYDAASKEEADKNFAYSCRCCCEKGIHLECDKCNIAFVHNLVIACFGNGNITEGE